MALKKLLCKIVMFLEKHFFCVLGKSLIVNVSEEMKNI